ncbi:MAG: UDP-N-acetylmuramoyl-L-alanine--D-glutamate ligase, partial [Candidatus Omnitrophica bacterium]|nr:UDP-N-acetylmuramoyl-L-alanine--D-glutamate ligase [Candidatus Omnitrophota bacterium]
MIDAVVMSSFDLKNKKVTVLGAARSGVAAAHLALRLGATAKLSEFKKKSDVGDDIEHLNAKVICEFGGHTQAFIEDSDYVILSPGIRQDCSAALWAIQNHIPVLGEIELAYRFCPAPVIAVTGSNGKTTVSTLIAECLKKAGRKVFLCGNIGLPFSKVVEQVTPDSYVVLEVSSFQLESTEQFRPYVGVLLNFSENHLDRHKDLEEYFQAKSKIFANQKAGDFAVLNYQDQRIRKLAEKLTAQVAFFNTPEKVVLSSNPNELAVMEAVRLLGVSPETCHEVFGSFKGVEHRMEWVRTLDGVDYINDSKSTTAEATRW